jgi:hypothetical protein
MAVRIHTPHAGSSSGAASLRCPRAGDLVRADDAAAALGIDRTCREVLLAGANRKLAQRLQVVASGVLLVAEGVTRS